MRLALLRLAAGIAACTLTIGVLSPSRTEAGNSSSTARVTNGLLAFYDFDASGGGIVKDRSGKNPPVHLRINNTKAVRRSKGTLEVRGKTLIRSDKPASRVINAIRKSGEITIEAWIRPTSVNQSGPARIVTLSKDANERNFTLGQDGNKYDARLRTTRTTTNGMPSLGSPARSLTAKLTHVCYTRDRSGKARIYVNGKRSAERTVSGNTSNWNGSFRLSLANELSGDRQWLGTFYLVAIYSRDLSSKEIEQNFKAGAGAGAALLLAARKKREQNARLFQKQVAPLLARHCLECHGWKSTRGKLDLTRKFTAFTTRKNGPVIVPGKASASLLWKTVASGAMPKKRPPLSDRERRVLQYWIDTGAVWSLDHIDPKQYALRRSPGSNWIRRLTVLEYIETVRSAVGVDVAKDSRKILPRDVRADGFSNTAYNLTVDLEHVHAYANLAQIVAGRMDVVKFAGKYSKSSKFDDASMGKIIAGMGKRLWRRPLKNEEINTFLRIPKAVAKEKGTFKEAVRFILEAMLQSPGFIYRIEDQRGDGNARPLSNYELASRLSYTLWGGPPDAELMRAADAGELSNKIRIVKQVKRMLKDQRVISRSAQFIDEWLNLGRLDNMQPNPQHFPNWNAQLAADMRAESLTFFEEVVWKQKRPLPDLLNAQFTFLTPRLAKHYGLNPHKSPRSAEPKSPRSAEPKSPRSAEPKSPRSADRGVNNAFKRYDLTKTPSRGGLLTHGSLLTIGGDEASMVTRGLFVLHDLLDSRVDDPPPCVDTTPVPTKPGQSQRAIAMMRINNKSCSACHSKFEPLAFGLEKFDGLGTYHDKDEHGNKLREDGEILFPGTSKPVSYRTSAELMNLLAKSERVQRTITRRITQWAIGRPLVDADEEILKRIHKSAQKGGGTYEAVITAIVMSDLVLKMRTEKEK